MITQAAARASVAGPRSVFAPGELFARGITRSQLTANLAARRWQRCGAAVVLHRGTLTQHERWRAALVNCGPGSVLTAFTAAELAGLEHWERDEIHVLVRQGARTGQPHGLPIVVHRTRAWPPVRIFRLRAQALPGALLVAAGTFSTARPGCGLLAAAVQQRLVEVVTLRAELDRAIRTRHRAELRRTVEDIDGGSDALSEIDFVRLCRRASPVPQQQAVRRDGTGRRRYLDASWRRADGRLVVAEVDGAMHLIPGRWWDDQARQNELVLAEAVVLRFPTVVIRTDPKLVTGQLRRALALS